MYKSGTRRRKAASGGPEFSLCPGLRVVRFQGRSIRGVRFSPPVRLPQVTAAAFNPLSKQPDEEVPRARRGACLYFTLGERAHRALSVPEA